jgi:xylono-1,5-lactonase
VDIRCVSTPGARLGEGALWDAARGVVWWVDIKQPSLHAHHIGTGGNHVQPLAFRLTAIALAQEGQLIGASDLGIIRLAVAPNLQVSVSEVIATVDEPPGNRFNDGKVDAAGRFWVGTMDDAEATASGSLYRLDSNASVTPARGGIGVPNGPAFLADGTLLTTDSSRQLITAVTLDESGQPIAERPFACFTREQGYPDGMTVDSTDHVWIAFWDGWCVRRLSPQGEIVSEISLPVQRPTCAIFAGASLEQMFITSATVGLTEEALARQPLAGGLIALIPGVTGRPPARFAG